jgi:hypothetical protein
MRDSMINALGGKCEQCGSTEKLQFNHKFKRYWDPAKFNRVSRMKRYLEDMNKGHINLLCSHCNALFQPAESDEVPF